MNNPYLFRALRMGPAIVARLVEAVPEERWDTTTDPDRFTFREAVAHLADWETIFLYRMRQALMEPGSGLQGIDESLRAQEMDYLSTDPREQAKAFAQRREVIARWLEARSAEDWGQTVVHSEKGRQTLEDQASMLVCHDTYHIDHLAGFLP